MPPLEPIDPLVIESQRDWRRLVHVDVSHAALAKALAAVVEGIPDGCAVANARYNVPMRQVQVIVQHNSFAPVGEGQPYPKVEAP